MLAVRNRGTGGAVVVSADDPMAGAVRATNRNSGGNLGAGGAVVATGEGCAAIVARAHTGHDFAVYVQGYTDAGELEPNKAIFAYGEVYLAGPVYIEGDLVVTGTIYCDDVRPLSDRQRAAARSRAAEQQSRLTG